MPKKGGVHAQDFKTYFNMIQKTLGTRYVFSFDYRLSSLGTIDQHARWISAGYNLLLHVFSAWHKQQIIQQNWFPTFLKLLSSIGLCQWDVIYLNREL